MARGILGADDDDVFLRYVLMEAAVPGGDTLDLVDDVLSRDDFAEYAVTPALRARRRVVEKIVITDIDEELRGRRVGIVRARHRHRVALVLQAIDGFVGHRRTGRFLLHAGFHAAALDHEAVDDPVKYRVVVMAIVNVLQEVLDRSWRVLGVELE